MSKAQIKDFLSKSIHIRINRHIKNILNEKEVKEYLAENTGITKTEAGICIKVLTSYIDKFEFDVNLSQDEAGDIVNDFIWLMSDILFNQKKLTLPNFGSFRIKESKSRVARNPRTGEEVTVPDRYVVRFKAAGYIKDQLEDDKQHGE